MLDQPSVPTVAGTNPMPQLVLVPIQCPNWCWNQSNGLIGVSSFRAAQLKIEAALEEMNREAKEIISLKGTWRRGGAGKKVRSGRRNFEIIRMVKLVWMVRMVWLARIVEMVKMVMMVIIAGWSG